MMWTRILRPILRGEHAAASLHSRVVLEFVRSKFALRL
jgi:hypothetical protein